MGPAEIANHSDRKVVIENFGLVGVVMHDGGYAGQQILDTAPKQADAFRDSEVVANGRVVGTVNVESPIGRVGVWAAAEAGEEIELQVVVGVDETREDNEAVEVHGFVQTPIQTAGIPATSSSDLPAASKMGRSGSPKTASCW